MQRLVKSDRFENRLWPAARGQPGGQIGETDKLIARICGELEQCRRLVAIPGIGPITATATVAAIGHGAAFKTKTYRFY
jgi:transposase